MSRYVINSVTGEVETEIREGDSILRSRSREKLASSEIINDGRSYIKVYTSSISTILRDDKLSGSELAILFAMLPYISYDSGLVAYDNGRYMPMKKLVELSGLSERSGYRAVESLIQKRIIAKVRTGHDIKFYINPYIFMKGVRVNKTLESMFAKSKYVAID